LKQPFGFSANIQGLAGLTRYGKRADEAKPDAAGSLQVAGLFEVLYGFAVVGKGFDVFLIRVQRIGHHAPGFGQQTAVVRL
jgi:hypothetical protein